MPNLVPGSKYIHCLFYLHCLFDFSEVEDTNCLGKSCEKVLLVGFDSEDWSFNIDALILAAIVTECAN